jgi:hypothetical protein
MSDEQINVDPAVDTPPAPPAEDTPPAPPADVPPAPPADDTPPAPPADNAGASTDPDQSRTGFVTGARAGDECICPDGRKGTVHKFDEGLVCIPNHEQSE